ncbi:MAG: echA1 protein [Candidatus Parcubacteria bacterium]
MRSEQATEQRVVDVLGWGGVLAILVAYILASTGMIVATGAAFQILNALGALGLIVEARVKKDAQVVALNVIWLAIAAWTLARSIMN